MKTKLGIEIGACLVLTTMCITAPALAANNIAASSQIVQHSVNYEEALKLRTPNVYIKEHGIDYLCGHISVNEYEPAPK